MMNYSSSRVIKRSGVIPEGMEQKTEFSANVQRYHSDPAYRDEIIRTALRWAEANKERKRAADKRWSKLNGAAASRRYRQRQKRKAA